LGLKALDWARMKGCFFVEQIEVTEVFELLDCCVVGLSSGRNRFAGIEGFGFGGDEDCSSLGLKL